MFTIQCLSVIIEIKIIKNLVSLNYEEIMLRRIYTLILAVTLLISSNTFSQVSYQGPVQGSVPSGAMVNTDTLTDSPNLGDVKIINDKNLSY